MKKLLILLFLFIILSFTISAQLTLAINYPQSTNYLYTGLTLQNSYVQPDAYGLWSGSIPSTIKSYSGNYTFAIPLVADLDGEGINEIIVTRNNSIDVYNYSAATGLILRDNDYYGEHMFCGGQFLSNPGLDDANNDGAFEIIYYNTSHIYLLNSTPGLIATQSVSLSNYNFTGTGLNGNTYYNNIKCTGTGSTSNGDHNCVFLLVNRSGAIYNLVFLDYDIETNTLSNAIVASSITIFNLQKYHSIAITDGNNNGFVEAYIEVDDSSNGDLYVFECTIGDNPSCVQKHKKDKAVGTQFSDIIVNNFDFINPTINYAWLDSSKKPVMTSFVINLNATSNDRGAALFDYVKGDVISENLFENSAGIYGETTNDVCYYLRNYGGNTGTGQHSTDDVIICGTSSNLLEDRTIFQNTANSTTGTYHIHNSMICGDNSLLLNQHAICSNTKVIPAGMSGDYYTIPVDYQKMGSVDIIGVNDQRLSYYDDNYVNNNWQMTSLVMANTPICLGMIYPIHLYITDTEGDNGACYGEEFYNNGTSKSIFSNQTSIVYPDGMTCDGTGCYVNFDYYADELGLANLRLYCKDDYHTYSYANVNPRMVVNGTDINIECYDPTNSMIQVIIQNTSLTNVTSTTSIRTQIKTIFGTFGAGAQDALSAIWVIIMIVIGFGLFAGMKKVEITGQPAFFAGLIIEVLMMILGWIFGMLTTIPLVILSLMFILIISGIVYTKVQGGN